MLETPLKKNANHSAAQPDTARTGPPCPLDSEADAANASRKTDPPLCLGLATANVGQP